MAYSVAKNTSFLTTASILQKIISFAYFTVVARLIGVENTGQYFFALTFQSIFAVVADFGLAAVLTREMAKSPDRIQSLFSTALGGKIFFGGGAYLLIVIAINILGYPEATRNLIYLAGITMWFDNIHSLFYAVFRAKRDLKFESAGLVGSQFLTLAIGSVALYYHLPLIWLIAAYAIPSVINALYSGFFAVRIYKIKLKILLDKVAWREFLLMAWPFALAGIIGRLYSYSDSLIMSKMLTAQELGWWSVPYKVTFAFQFIPVALSASVFPVFSALYVSDRVSVGRLFDKAWRYLFTIVFPLSAGIFAIAGQFIVRVYGEAYEPSVLPLRILVFSLIFGYLAFITGALLNAIGQQKKQTGVIGIALISNVALNLILIPRYGIVGAAVSALISNSIMWSCGLALACRYTALSISGLVKQSVRSLVPSIIMGVIVYWLCLKMNFIFAIPIGAVIYVVLLFVFGGLTKNVIGELKSKLIGKSSYENFNNNS